MRRRSFLSRSAAALMFVTAPWRARAGVLAPAGGRWDFVIVGAGTAGMPAAIFAARRGARVLLLDAAGDVGGTLHLADGEIAAAGTRAQLAKGITDDSPDRHYADILRLSGGRADPRIARRVADEAPAMVNWLLDNGLVPLPEHPITGHPGRDGYSVARYLWGKEKGRALLTVLRRELAAEVGRGRVDVQLDTRVRSLLVDGNGAVTGVRAHDASRRVLELHGRHVLLTTGGYAMNPGLFERLVGQPAYAASSYPYSQGDGLELATSAGGYLRGQDLHRCGSGSILTSNRFPARVYARFTTMPQQRLPWEIWVDSGGRRFIREDEPSLLVREQTVVRLPELRYAIVFDRGILDAAPIGIPGWTREQLLTHFETHPMFAHADSLDALATRARIDATGLQQTVRDYNTAVARRGRDALGREHLPRAISQPPFYAITQLGHSATSSAGIVVDGALRVLRGGGAPVPNLYAAGEVLGSGATLGNAFVPGMMLTPAMSLGRWLGQTLPI